jgi:hypothetical protein
MPYTGWPVMVEFDATGSYDPDPGDTLTYEWDFDNDGTFGDSYDSGTDDNPTKMYDFTHQDDVCVRISDGNGGEATCCVDIDVTIHPTKNIDVTNSGTLAVDIAVRHTSGDVMILYANGTARRYSASSYYQSYTTPYVPASGTGEYIDAGENDWWFVIRGRISGSYYYMYLIHIRPSDSWYMYTSYMFYRYNYNGNNYGPRDANVMAQVGSRSNGMTADYGYQYSWMDQYTYVRCYYPSYWYQYRYHWSYYPTNGLTYLPYVDTVAAEADPTGDYLWWLEDDECIASRWEVAGSSTMNYAGPYFGTQNTPTDGDDGLNNGLDITACDAGIDNMYVLDELSTGDYSIKHFDWNAGSTTALTQFGDSDDWDYDPFRIDGDISTGGGVYVLHSDGTNDAFSFFQPFEIPTT